MNKSTIYNFYLCHSIQPSYCWVNKAEKKTKKRNYFQKLLSFTGGKDRIKKEKEEKEEEEERRQGAFR